ncbi:universal stress protein [Hymenobacter metallilatus]|uniref:Universal stress protein n=1 Tax=Hymenobacter metallilatus TaxID=2493666 RepID=A0A3R9M750_9BACT|nr:universal stress protein [Hymenobacter metallilatus]RSK31827.1 universal stress protein [Hymenobacter metallilatus]
MATSLLILTDFFQAANAALNYATNLAAPLDARLVLLHVRRDSVLDPEMFTGQLSNLSREAIHLALSSLARDLSVPVVAEVGHGRVAFAVADAVSRHHPALVILGRSDTQGTPDELVTITALDILRTAPYPMLVVPHTVHNPALPRRVLLATDAGEFTLGQFAGTARHLLNALHAELTLLHVTSEATDDTGALDSVARTGLTADLTTVHTRTVAAATATEGILEVAEKYDLLVLIARRRSFLGQLFHHSVTADIIRRSPVPVLVLPAQE